MEGPTLEQDPTPRCDCGGVVTTQVHYPGRSLSACAVCALTAANVAMTAGWPVTLEPLLVGPQPRDLPGPEYEPTQGIPAYCLGCAAPEGAIGPIHTCGRQS